MTCPAKKINKHWPDRSTKEPHDGDKAICTSDIRQVGDFCHHAFYGTAITVESASQTATWYIWLACSILMGNHKRLHKQPCKFSNGLKKSDGLRSDIFRHFQKFSDILRPAVGQLFRTTFSDTSQAVTQTFLDWQFSRHPDCQKYVSFFQLISFAYIQTVRKCQLFSVQQLDGQKHVRYF